jgi:hypothetical protein
MNLLPVQDIPENLQLSQKDITEERCKLIEDQIKYLNKELETIKKENDNYKSLITELYLKLQEVEECETDCDCCTSDDNDEEVGIRANTGDSDADLNKSIFVE